MLYSTELGHTALGFEYITVYKIVTITCLRSEIII